MCFPKRKKNIHHIFSGKNITIFHQSLGVSKKTLRAQKPSLGNSRVRIFYCKSTDPTARFFGFFGPMAFTLGLSNILGSAACSVRMAVGSFGPMDEKASWWWFFSHPFAKYAQVKVEKMKPQDSGWKCQKCLSCHYLGFGDFPNQLPLPETNSSHLKIDGWKTILSFWDGPAFRGELVVSGSVTFLWLENPMNKLPFTLI